MIRKYYREGSLSYKVLSEHAKVVAAKSLEIAEGLALHKPDLAFLEEAAILHDIGIFRTRQTDIGCHGESRYICHGYIGREILEEEGFPRHALVCERHIGSGLDLTDISEHDLPLPKREMLPVSIEEKIICLADKFFSKRPGMVHVEKKLEEIRKEMLRLGPRSLTRFEELHRTLISR